LNRNGVQLRQDADAIALLDNKGAAAAREKGQATREQRKARKGTGNNWGCLV
jgi:hypothetical protein